MNGQIKMYDTYAEVNIINKRANLNYTYLIDLDDLNTFKKYNWRTNLKSNLPYLCTKNNIYFHRLILDCFDNNIEIDHINRNTLDNRKQNLRFATRTEQIYNTFRKSKLGIKGVYYSKNRNTYHAECTINDKRYCSPTYKNMLYACYYRYLMEKYLLKDFLVYNSNKLIENINKLSEKQKQEIEIQFFNKFNFIKK